MHSSRWSNTTKLVVLSILILVCISLLVAFRVMIAPTIVGCLLAFVLSHPVNWVQHRTGWRRSVAIITVYVLGLIILAAMPAIFIPNLLNSLASLQELLSNLLTDLQSTASPPLFQFGDFQFELGNLLQQVNAALQEGISMVAASLFTLALDVTTGILISIYALVLAFWLLRDGSKLQRLLLERIPGDYQGDAVRLGQQLAQTWTGFLQGQLVVAVVMGLLVWVVMGILGLPNVAGLALLAAVMEFLPSIGPAISGWIGTSVALFQGSTWLPIPNLPFAILVGVIYFIFAQLENIYFVPRFVGGRLKLDPAVALLGVLSATVIFGALGVLLATPVIASLRILFAYVYRKLLDVEPFEPLQWDEAGVRIPGLVAGRKIEGVIFDLDGTLAHIDWRMANIIACRTEWAERFTRYEQRQHLARGFMRIAEGNINRWISLLIWLRRSATLARLMPLLDRLRGFAPSEEMQPLAGVNRFIASLASDYRLGLITTRSRVEVDTFLAKAGINAAMFTCIVTQEQFRHLPPHGEALSIAVGQLDIQSNVLLMVADSEVQLRPARTLNMVTAGVTSGICDEQHLSDADLILDSVLELEDRL